MMILAMPDTRRVQLAGDRIFVCFEVSLRDPVALKALREVHGYCQQDMADRLRIPLDVWQGYEDGTLQVEDMPDQLDQAELAR